MATHTTLTAAINRIESSPDVYDSKDMLIMLEACLRGVETHTSTVDACDIGEAYVIARSCVEAGMKEVIFNDKEFLQDCIKLARIGVN